MQRRFQSQTRVDFNLAVELRTAHVQNAGAFTIGAETWVPSGPHFAPTKPDSDFCGFCWKCHFG